MKSHGSDIEEPSWGGEEDFGTLSTHLLRQKSLNWGNPCRKGQKTREDLLASGLFFSALALPSPTCVPTRVDDALRVLQALEGRCTSPDEDFTMVVRIRSSALTMRAVM